MALSHSAAGRAHGAGGQAAAAGAAGGLQDGLGAPPRSPAPESPSKAARLKSRVSSTLSRVGRGERASATTEPLTLQAQLQAEPEPEPEPEPAGAGGGIPEGDPDTRFREGMFASYLQRVEQKGCAWRQELQRCGIFVENTAPTTAPTTEEIVAQMQAQQAAEAARAQAAQAAQQSSHDEAESPRDASPADEASRRRREESPSRGAVSVKGSADGEWEPGEILAISSGVATVRYSGGTKETKVLLRDPSRVKLMRSQ